MLQNEIGKIHMEVNTNNSLASLLAHAPMLRMTHLDEVTRVCVFGAIPEGGKMRLRVNGVPTAFTGGVVEAGVSAFYTDIPTADERPFRYFEAYYAGVGIDSYPAIVLDKQSEGYCRPDGSDEWRDIDANASDVSVVAKAG